jgi:phospholipid/cholesterol/gamma-HCH transport system substrate-binding protein
MSTRRRLLAAATGILGLAVVTGCGPTMADLPLPGNGVSGHTIQIEIQFDEALNLAQGAQVKVNGVYAGKVRNVSAKNFKAIATIDIQTAAQMRTDASARLRYTTPLGELFVDVTNPATGTLMRNGDELDPTRSTTAPTVEDALSSASLLINGGGLNQLQTVTDQLNTALGGREQTVRQLLDRANTFLQQANGTTADVDRALNALAAVSKIANENRSTIDEALREIQPAAAVLRQNTPGFTELLAKLATFSATANNVVGKTRSQILQMVQQVSPVLQEFLNSSSVLGPSLTGLVGVGNLLNAVAPGDYLNLSLALDFTGLTLPNLLGAAGGGSTGTNGNGTGGLLGGLLGGLTGGSGSGSSGNPLSGVLGGLLGGILGGARTSAPAATTGASSPIGLSALLGGAR